MTQAEAIQLVKAFSKIDAVATEYRNRNVQVEFGNEMPEKLEQALKILSDLLDEYAATK